MTSTHANASQHLSNLKPKSTIKLPPYASASHKDAKVSAPSSMPSLCRARHNLEARDASARPQTRKNGCLRPVLASPTYNVLHHGVVMDKGSKDKGDKWRDWFQLLNDQNPKSITQPNVQSMWKTMKTNSNNLWYYVSLKFFKIHGHRVLENFDFFPIRVTASKLRSLVVAICWKMRCRRAGRRLRNACCSLDIRWMDDEGQNNDVLYIISLGCVHILYILYNRII